MAIEIKPPYNKTPPPKYTEDAAKATLDYWKMCMVVRQPPDAPSIKLTVAQTSEICRKIYLLNPKFWRLMSHAKQVQDIIIIGKPRKCKTTPTNKKKAPQATEFSDQEKKRRISNLIQLTRKSQSMDQPNSPEPIN